MSVDLVFAVFALVSLAAFRVLRPPVAALSVYLAGWILLPVGHFPPASAEAEFPYWITGLAVPSSMLLTKAWVAPAAALFGVLVFDRAALRQLRPVWLDLPVVLWCLWPLLQSAGLADARPAGWLASLYLAGCWGLPWLLGRLYFSARDGQLVLAKGLALSALACLPFSLVEGVIGPKVYGWVYELHPFRFDGAVRYLGYRPLGFFENGNQFGLWVSLCAFAAAWLALALPAGREARAWRVVAVIVVAMALAAQSVGGIALLLIGLAFLSASRWVQPRTMLVASLALLILGGAVYVSGKLPILAIGKDTLIGRRVVDAFRSVGRGSFTWRISQDQKLLPAAMARPLVGSGEWDWWRDQGIRPWGLTLLLIGQFGLIGLGLALMALLAPAARAAWHSPSGSAWRPPAAPLMLAAMIALAALDGLMNSFIFFPALLAAGALSAAPATALRRRGEITRFAMPR